MTTKPTYVIPATLIADIKAGLIALGYATESTPDSFIQDAYYKYIIVRQTGMNPNVPYALELLPLELQEQLAPTTPIGNPNVIVGVLSATYESIQFSVGLIGGPEWLNGHFYSRVTGTTEWTSHGFMNHNSENGGDGSYGSGFNDLPVGGNFEVYFDITVGDVTYESAIIPIVLP